MSEPTSTALVARLFELAWWITLAVLMLWPWLAVAWAVSGLVLGLKALAQPRARA